MRLLLLIILFFLYFFINYLSAEILDFDGLITNSLADQFAQDEIDDFIKKKDENAFINYLFFALFILIKITMVALLLELGCFFYNIKIKFKVLFHIVVKSEFLFLLTLIVKTMWFYFFNTDFTLEQFQNFQPLALINIVNEKDLEPWFIYPLQTINLFELAYFLFLAYLLGKQMKDTDYGKFLKITVSSYGVGLMIWIITVMYIILNIS